MTGPRLKRPRPADPALARRLEDFTLRRGQPLPLFEALAHSGTALEDLAGGTRAAIEATCLPIRLREILILRTVARWGARAEWDVHVLLYAPVAPLSASEVEWLGGAGHRVAWTARERLLIDVADSLREVATLHRNLWDGLAHAFTETECAEILMVATQYVKVALMTNALEIPALVPSGPGIADRVRT